MKFQSKNRTSALVVGQRLPALIKDGVVFAS